MTQQSLIRKSNVNPGPSSSVVFSLLDTPIEGTLPTNGVTIAVETTLLADGTLAEMAVGAITVFHC